MIKMTYRTEEGLVEASFETVEEFEAFKDKIKAIDKAKADKAKEEAEKRAQEVSDRWNELKADMKDLVARAHRYGVSPEGFVALVKSAMFDQSEDRCEPGCCKCSDKAEEAKAGE